MTHNQPITLDELLERCMGELQFAQNILKSFLDCCHIQLDEIRAEIESGCPDALFRKIHRLKGTAATVAAQPLHASLERLEALVHSGSGKPEATRQLLDQFDQAVAEYDKVSRYVESELLK